MFGKMLPAFVTCIFTMYVRRKYADFDWQDDRTQQVSKVVITETKCFTVLLFTLRYLTERYRLKDKKILA